MKDKDCLLLYEKRPFPNLCHCVQTNQMVVFFVVGFFVFLFGWDLLFEPFFSPLFSRKKKRLDDVGGGKRGKKKGKCHLICD